MLGSFIRRGAIAGLAGGAASALFLLLVGESTIGDAIRLEEERGGGGGEELYTRGTQVFGGALGVVLVSVALGVVFAATFAAVRHRLPGRDDWRRSVTWAGMAFVVVYLVPFAKYPPNPPAVGNPDTIDERTILYFAMLAWSIGAAYVAVRLGTWLRGRGFVDAARLCAAVIAWVGLVAVGYMVLPGSRDAVTAPATLIWRFRLASAGGALLLWAVTGVVFGFLRLPAESRVRRARRSEARTGVMSEP